MSATVYSGNYEIQELIAQGGMGAVYKALDRKFDRIVALKVVHPHLCGDPAFVKRFQREARDMARLSHENIVIVHDVGQDQATHYLAMEYFPGSNLRDMIASGGAIPLMRAINITRQVANALSFTHSHGIIHRDIKPANVLVDNRGRAKLTDFGIAAALDHAPLTSTGQIIGSLPYMPPEQARDAALDGRSDLYSLGMTCYELLSGLNPRRNLSNAAILGMLLSEDKMPPLEFPVSVPLEIQQIVKDLLKYRPNDRIQDADTLLNRLEDIRPIWSGATTGTRAVDNAPTIVRSIPQFLAGANEVGGDKTVAVLDPRLDPRLNPQAGRKSSIPKPTIPKLNIPWRKYAAIVVVLSLGVGASTYLYSNIDFTRFAQVIVPRPDPKEEEQRKQADIAKAQADAAAKAAADKAKAVAAAKTKAAAAKPPADKTAADRSTAAKPNVTESSPKVEKPTAPVATPVPTPPTVFTGQGQAPVQTAAVDQAAAAKAAADQAAALRKQALSNLLGQVQRLMARKDLAGLEQISDLSDNRRRLLQNLFQNYSALEVSVDEVVEGPTEAKAVLLITKLIQDDGEAVDPAPLLRRTKLKVPREGTSWGHVVW